MKVKQLIEKLKEFPEECNVFVEENSKYKWIMLVEEDAKMAVLQVVLKIL